MNGVILSCKDSGSTAFVGVVGLISLAIVEGQKEDGVLKCGKWVEYILRNLDLSCFGRTGGITNGSGVRKRAFLWRRYRKRAPVPMMIVPVIELTAAPTFVPVLILLEVLVVLLLEFE